MKRCAQLCVLIFSFFCTTQTLKAESINKADPTMVLTPSVHPGGIDKAELAKKYNLAEGKDIYNSSCTACHATGLLAAPKFCDIAAWKPRMAHGMETLIKHTVEGFNGMPSKGGLETLSIDQASNAVAYMVDKCLF